MAFDWRWLLVDIRTRLPVAELPVIGGNAPFGEVLNGPGSARFALPINPGGGLTAALLAPPDAVLAIEAGGLLRWAGPILTHNYDINKGTVEFGCEGIWTYVRRRVAAFLHRFDPTTMFINPWRDAYIGKYLLDEMQALPGGNLGIDTGSIPTVGTITDLTVFGYERKYYGDIIERNAATRGGYDWRLQPEWSAGPNSQMLWRWVSTFPAVGRRTDIVWELGGNADIPAVTFDATNIAYAVHATGLGTGEVMPVSTATNPALIAAHILLETSESHSDVSEQVTLDRYAQRRLDRGVAPVITPTVDIDIDELGTFVIGDQVRVKAQYGLLNIDSFYRVTAYDVDPAAGLIHVTCAPLDLFG